MKTVDIDFSLENEKCTRCFVKYVHFILRARKCMRHDITQTMVLLNGHKTFVCSASLHSFHSSTAAVGRPTVTEWNANDDGRPREDLFLPFDL